MCPNYSRSWSLTSQSHILSIAYLNYNGFCPIISGLGPGDRFHYLARLPGAPSTPPPPPNPQTNSVITTQLLQITAARALFVIKLEQRQFEPAAISASNYLLRASCLIDPNWRERRPRSDRGRRGVIESSDRKTHQETEAVGVMGTSVIIKDIGPSESVWITPITFQIKPFLRHFSKPAENLSPSATR